MSRLLTASDLTTGKKRRKISLLNQAVRKATTETKESFFDYTDNPMWVANLEKFVPFSNFSYNNIKLLIKNPVGWLSTFQILNTLQQNMNQEEYFLDEDQFK